MEAIDLKSIWQSYEAKLNQSMTLNRKIIWEIQTQKIDDKLSHFKRGQVLGVVLGILWVLFLVMLVIANHIRNIYFTFSISALALLNVYAIAMYIRHLSLVAKVDLSQGIMKTQKQVAGLKYSMINVARILILQTPLYCTFWCSNEFVQSGPGFWFVYIPILFFFTIASVYVYKNLTLENIHKKWVRNLMEAFGGKELSKAIQYLDEIEEFEKE